MSRPMLTARHETRPGRGFSDRSRPGILGILLALTVLVTAACSSSGNSGPAAAGTFDVGAIISQTGAGAVTYAGTADILKAWVKHTNDNGGINGLQVDLTIKDDKSTPAGAVQAANELVRDGVIALVQGGSFMAASFAKPLTTAGIPVICGLPSANPPYLTEKNFYPCAPAQSASTTIIVKAALQAGYKSMGVVSCSEAPACAASAADTKVAGEKLGVKVDVLSTSQTAPSYAAPCLALKDAKAEMVFTQLSDVATVKFVKECAQQDYNPAILPGQVSDRYLELTGPNKFLGVTESTPWFADTPALNTFREVVQKDPAAAAAYRDHPDSAAIAWATGELFRKAAEKGGLKQGATAQDVTAALESLKGETVDGLIAPVDYTAGKKLNQCGFIISIEDGKFADPNGLKLVCADGA